MLASEAVHFIVTVRARNTTNQGLDPNADVTGRAGKVQWYIRDR